MRTGTAYFYLDDTIKKDNEEFYKVIEVPVYDDWIPSAEDKAEFLAKLLGKKLAGGLFTSKTKPYSFKEMYTVYRYQIKGGRSNGN